MILGIPIPVNSVGILPLEYFDCDARSKAILMRTNAAVFLQQLLVKTKQKGEASFFFTPFPRTKEAEESLSEIDSLISRFSEAQEKENELAKTVTKKAIALADLCREGVHYLQTYDWPFLMSVVVSGYIGWIGVVLVHIIHPKMQRFVILSHKPLDLHARHSSSPPLPLSLPSCCCRGDQL